MDVNLNKKKISYDILGMLTSSSVSGMQLIMWGKNMIALVVGWVGECWVGEGWVARYSVAIP